MRSILYYIVSRINKIQNSTTSITSDITDLKEDVAKLENDNFITAGLSSNHIMTNNSEFLTLTEKSKNGTKFSIDNGNIIVGDNVSKIMVTTNVSWWKDVAIGDILEIHVYKNSTDSARNIMIAKSTTWENSSIVSFPLTVQKDDVIKLQVWNNNRTGSGIAGGNDTYITIQEINVGD